MQTCEYLLPTVTLPHGTYYSFCVINDPDSGYIFNLSAGSGSRWQICMKIRLEIRPLFSSKIGQWPRPVLLQRSRRASIVQRYPSLVWKKLDPQWIWIRVEILGWIRIQNRIKRPGL